MWTLRFCSNNAYCFFYNGLAAATNFQVEVVASPPGFISNFLPSLLVLSATFYLVEERTAAKHSLAPVESQEIVAMSGSRWLRRYHHSGFTISSIEYEPYAAEIGNLPAD